MFGSVSDWQMAAIEGRLPFFHLLQAILGMLCPFLAYLGGRHRMPNAWLVELVFYLALSTGTWIITAELCGSLLQIAESLQAVHPCYDDGLYANDVHIAQRHYQLNQGLWLVTLLGSLLTFELGAHRRRARSFRGPFLRRMS